MAARGENGEAGGSPRKVENRAAAKERPKRANLLTKKTKKGVLNRIYSVKFIPLYPLYPFISVTYFVSPFSFRLIINHPFCLLFRLIIANKALLSDVYRLDRLGDFL